MGKKGDKILVGGYSASKKSVHKFKKRFEEGRRNSTGEIGSRTCMHVCMHASRLVWHVCMYDDVEQHGWSSLEIYRVASK